MNSHSFLVRLYYQKRIFMGFCCVSCEILYLMVSLMVILLACLGFELKLSANLSSHY